MNKKVNIVQEIIKEHSLVLFDGVCNLCNHAVQFIIKNDNKDIFMFAPLEHQVIIDFLKSHPKDYQDLDTILLITSKKIYTKSSAALQIAKHLKGLYPLLFIFYAIPKPFRDLLYDFIAKNRYKWFGKKDHCMMPNTALKNKFI